MEYIQCSHLATSEDITEIEHMFGDEYLARVIFREGDRQWGQWMTIKTSELVEHLFGEDHERTTL